MAKMVGAMKVHSLFVRNPDQICRVMRSTPATIGLPSKGAMPTTSPPQITVDKRLDDGWAAVALRGDVGRGLTATPKELPPKWFYDDFGSQLFEQITRLSEYYPTEAERQSLRRHAHDIAHITGATHVVELGAGNTDKTRTVLDAFHRAGQLDAITVLDVSGEFLERSAEDLSRLYPEANVHAVVGDFEHHLDALPTIGRRVILFLGGTIGNFSPADRQQFLSNISDSMRPGDAFVLGADLVKGVDRLELAYDDPQGVTEAFNKNILTVLNRELGANFDLSKFDHVARWDPENEWVDIGLRSTADQTVNVRQLDLQVKFARNEYMRTEISAKFRPAGLAGELSAAGLGLVEFWTDDRGDYSVTLSVK